MSLLFWSFRGRGVEFKDLFKIHIILKIPDLTNSIRNFEEQADLFFNFPFIDFSGCVSFNNHNSK